MGRTPRVRPHARIGRPFYGEYAWAFDLLIDRPVEKECGVIAAWLVGREILPGAGILDAGCGTGRYSRELLAATAFVASYTPARRATRVDPMVALRYE